jgi:ATP-binding cassette subfamily B protein
LSVPKRDWRPILSDKPAVGLPSGLGRGPGGGPGHRFTQEKVRPKDAQGTLARLARLFRPSLPSVVAVLLLGALGAVTGLAAPWVVGHAIDALGNPGAAALGWLLAGLVLVYLVDAAGSWFQGRIMSRLSQTFARDFRQSLFRALTRAPLAVFDTRSHGDLMSRMSNDTDAVSQALAQSGAQILGSVLAVGGALGCMLWLSPILTVAALVTVPLVFALSQVVSRRTRRYFKEQQASLGALNSHMEECVNGFLEVKAFERESAALAEFSALNLRLTRVGTEAQIWAGLMMPLMNVINNVGLATLTGVGAWLVLGHSLTVGLIATFVGYSRQFGRPLNDIANTWNALQAAIAGAERVFEILDEPPEPADPPGAVVLDRPEGRVSFESIQFGYREGRPVLREFDLAVEPGQTIALVGPTGSGKTTVVNLLLRFYDPWSGRVLLDGTDLRQIRRSDVHRAFGVVLQDTWLLEGTIADNIRYGAPTASDAEVERAARTANAHLFIGRLPQGYQTPIRGNGSTLSQGQRQLLAIARAVLADAPCLVLDEATSNIDTLTELHVQEAMLRLMAGRTCFIIAHRLSTIREADRIVLIHEGRIVESGTHDQLLAAGGTYARMYQGSPPARSSP